MKTAIIGAGIAGIASAVRMACQGHQVEVFEANSYPGGKLSSFEVEGFRFDAGPSLFTMPMYIEELFELAQVEIDDFFTYQKLEVACNYFWEDGTRLTAFSDPERFAQSLEEVLGVPPERLRKALKDSERKYDLTGTIFLENSLHKAGTWLRPKVAKAMLQIPSLDIFKTMNAVNEQQLKHPKLVQLFNRFATYNGSNPYKASGILNIIPHFEHGFGTFFPKGGMYSITKSLYQLAEQKGVKFNFNTKVAEIICKNGAATGIRYQGKTEPYDYVISNMDIFYTYKHLLPKEKHPEKTLAQEKSSSALIFYWGVDRSFPELDLHNILFSDDYRHEFDCLAKGEISDDPTVYVHVSSKYHTADAPPNAENWFTMINVPFNAGQDWDQLIERAKTKIVEKINRVLGIELSQLIRCEAVLDPRSIEKRTSSHLGALYGTSSNDRMAAFLRHPNFSNRIKNLYFCGGSVHPGGGIPLCLLSAKIVSELIAAN